MSYKSLAEKLPRKTPGLRVTEREREKPLAVTAKQEKESNTQNAIHHFNRQNTGIMLREGFVDEKVDSGWKMRDATTKWNQHVVLLKCISRGLRDSSAETSKADPRLNSIMNYIKQIFYLTDIWMKPIYCLRFSVSIMIQKSFYGKSNAEWHIFMWVHGPRSRGAIQKRVKSLMMAYNIIIIIIL